MIVVKLNGGIGAQMLQYSLGRNLSLLNKTELYLDDTWYQKHNTDTQFPRNFALNRLQTNFKLVNHKSFFWKIRSTDRFQRWNPFRFHKVFEKDFNQFDSSVLHLGNNVILDGYWNSYKYFERIKSLLDSELTPSEAPNDKNLYCLKRIRSVNAVCVHFRRGDYGKTSFHGVLTKNYYETAIEIIKKKVINPYLFLFSDEPEAVLDNFKFDLPFELVSFNGNHDNLWDIQLMRNCQHHVIANSSFSWWGAWLNKNPDKLIIAPKIWIAEKERTMEDFIPKSWIRI